MLEEWAPIAFNLVEYRDGVFILAGIDEIQTMLDDQIVKTQVNFQIIRQKQNLFGLCKYYFAYW